MDQKVNAETWTPPTVSIEFIFLNKNIDDYIDDVAVLRNILPSDLLKINNKKNWRNLFIRFGHIKDPEADKCVYIAFCRYNRKTF